MSVGCGDYFLDLGQCTRFIVALLTMARKCNQPRCPLTNEWLIKMWYTCRVELHLAVKKIKL